MTDPEKNRLPALAGATILLLAAALAWWWLARPPAPPTVEPAVPAPPPALALLGRGVNLSNWLQHGRPTQAPQYAPDDADFRHIRALGLTHVRLLADPAALLTDRGLPDTEAFGALRSAIEAAQRQGLLVVLALQLPSPAKAGLAEREADRVALAGHWRWLAGALRDLPAAQLAFEPLNEPGTADARVSRELMIRLAAEVRRAAPRHTIVVSGHRYSGVDELAALRPLHDPNVVYGFHFYEPHNFTHQGADWGDPAWAALRDFPYPSSPERVTERLNAAAPETRDLLRWHGEERWNRERIRARLAPAAQWARTHGAAVWCSEFGVLKAHADPADRAAWLRDVRETLEADGIPWTHWDYAGPFGIVSGARGARVADAAAIEALGLTRD